MSPRGPRQIVAMGGGGFSMEPGNLLLDEYVLEQCEAERPRILFVPTASGDSDSYVRRFYETFAGPCDPSWLPLFNRSTADLTALCLDHDVLYFGGGNTVNALAVWRAHGLDQAIRAAWEDGVVLCGVSAGYVCWFDTGVTDSFGRGLAPMPAGLGLGLIGGAGCPHYDSDPLRRPTFQRLVGEGALPAGLAADDGCALHFIDGELAHVVSSRPEVAAYRVERAEGGGARETRLAARYLGAE